MPAVAIGNILVSHADVPDALAHEMAKQMFDNMNTMTAAHAAAKAITLENATKGLPIPLHPGAEAYYREAGVLK